MACQCVNEHYTCRNFMVTISLHLTSHNVHNAHITNRIRTIFHSIKYRNSQRSTYIVFNKLHGRPQAWARGALAPLEM